MAELAVVGPVPSPIAGPPWVIPAGGPTYDGFVLFVSSVMGVESINMPDATTLQFAYAQALNLTYIDLSSVPSQPGMPTIYAMAVYNFGAFWLVEMAQDNPNSTYWQDLRQSLGLNSFNPGIVNAAHDQGTGEGSMIPPWILNTTLLGLEMMKTPWGRAYLMIAGQWGTLWGITF